MILETFDRFARGTLIVTLNSFPAASSAVVVGASRGIGLALVKALMQSSQFEKVVACSRHPSDSTELAALVERWTGGLELQPVDLAAPDSIEALAAWLKAEALAPALVLNVSGLLHDGSVVQPEKRLEDLDPNALERVFAVNALGPALVMRHLLPLMRCEGKAVLAVMSARVGSISDNRLGGWYAYRASKAALNQFMKTASIEAARRYRNVILTALHPGTTDTALSAPFQAKVPEGKLFSTEFVAEHLLEVIERLGPEDSGSFRAWDDSEIPW
jgi:NAD(P)-dependent dehydrogenase (short-subunit alcohol dehydrogenase family)